MVDTNRTTNQEYLNALKKCASEACDAAYNANINGAINYADLECVSARRFEDDEGEVFYSVVIEEADPRNYDFHVFVVEYLKVHGYDGVEVITEW